MVARDREDLMTRDLYGYGNQYPDVRWPDEARLAVSLVLNVEEGAELASPPATSATKPCTKPCKWWKVLPICARWHFRIAWHTCLT